MCASRKGAEHFELQKTKKPLGCFSVKDNRTHNMPTFVDYGNDTDLLVFIVLLQPPRKKKT